MLPRTQRLTRQEFTDFFATGKRLHSPSLTLMYTPHERFRASAVISKKVAKGAVARNKFRRRVYAVFESSVREGLKRGVFICIAKEKAPTLTFDALKTELHQLIHKTSILG